MNRTEINGILKELEVELASGELDHYHQQKTQALAEQLQFMLKEGEDKLPSDEFLIKKIGESIEEFEVNHPKLTEIFGRISDLLSRGGI